MKPLFTIQAGEFVVGDYITRNFGKKFDVWVPGKDRGIDLLVTPKSFKHKGVRIQVKSSRSYRSAHLSEENIFGLGWYTIKKNKAKSSDTDFWIFVILTIKRAPYFIIIPTEELYKRLCREKGAPQLYLTVLEKNKCYDLRGVRKEDSLTAMLNRKAFIKKYPDRDYTKYLNAWDLLFKT